MCVDYVDFYQCSLLDHMCLEFVNFAANSKQKGFALYNFLSCLFRDVKRVETCMSPVGKEQHH